MLILLNKKIVITCIRQTILAAIWGPILNVQYGPINSMSDEPKREVIRIKRLMVRPEPHLSPQ